MSSTDLSNGSASNIPNKLIRAYLLGELEPAECDALEQRLLEQPDSFSLVEGIEDDLIESYVGGKLGAGDRENFERYFLCTQDRRTRVALVRGLARRSTSEPLGTAPVRTRSRKLTLAWPFAVAASLAALLLGVSAFAVYQQLENTRLSGQKRELQNEIVKQTEALNSLKEQAARSRLLARVTPPETSAVTASATLQPGSIERDSGELRRIMVSASVGTVQLRLVTPAATQIRRFRAVLSNFDGEEIFSWEQRRPTPAANRTIVLALPLELLPDDDYRLSLSAPSVSGRFDEIATYMFGIVRN